MSADFGIKKVKLLQCPSDFIQWKRSVTAVLNHDDPLCVWSEEEPNVNSINWRKANMKANSIIILCLSGTARSMLSRMFDYVTMSAKTLWEEINKMFSISSTQAAANLIAKFYSLELKDGDYWDKHKASFMLVIDELANHDNVVSDTEKVKRLLRTLPASLESISVACSLGSNIFDEITAAVKIERRKKKSG